jgi:hypothetical protein
MLWRSYNFLPYRDLNSDRPIVQPVASRYTDYATRYTDYATRYTDYATSYTDYATRYTD